MAVFLVNEGAHGHLQDRICAGNSCAVRAFSVTPAIAFKFAVISVPQQSIVVWIRFQVDASTIPAVAARRSTPRNILLATKCYASVPAVPGLHPYFRFINKHGTLDSLQIFPCVLSGPMRALFPRNKKAAPAQSPGPLESSSFLVRGLGMLRGRHTD